MTHLRAYTRIAPDQVPRTLTPHCLAAEALLSSILECGHMEGGALVLNPPPALMDALCIWGAEHAEYHPYNDREPDDDPAENWEQDVAVGVRE